MVYVPPQRGPQTIPQQFSSFIPVVEITKVTIENSDRGEGLSDFKKEALFDRNPHIDLTVREGQYDNLTITGGSTATTETKYDAYKNWQTYTADQGNANLIVHLQMKVPRGSSAFPSVINMESVRAGMSIWCVIYGGLSTQDTLKLSAQHNRTNIFTYSNVVGWDATSFSDWGDPERQQQSNGEIVDVYTRRVSFASTAFAQNIFDNFKDNRDIGLTAGASIRPHAVLSGTPVSDPSLEPSTTIHGPVDTLMVIQNGKISSKKIMYDNGRELPPINTSQVQDFRVLAKIESIPLDFSMVEKDLFPDLKSDLSGERIPLNSTYDEFSNIFLSRDIQDNCRFFFSINWKSIILNNSVFGKLIDDAGPSNLEELVRRTKINNITIFRRRVQGNSAVDSSPYYKPESGAYFDPTSPPKPFMENDPRDIIVESSDDQSGNLLSITNSDGSSIKEQENFGNVDIGGNSIRHFSCADQTVKNKSNGYYKYSVEINAADQSVEIVQEKLDILIGNINTIKEYYDDASKVTNSPNGIPPSYSQYIDTGNDPTLPAEQEYSPGDINTGAFNSRTGQFSQDFIDNKWLTGTGWKDIVDPALTSYVDVLKFFFNLGTQEDSIRTSLTTLVDPRMATPESIKTVIDTMQTNASKIESVLGVVYSTMASMSLAESQTPQEKSSAGSKNRLFMVAQESSNIFDSSLPENVGLDFFGTTEDIHGTQRHLGQRGLLSVSQGDLLTRANEQWTSLMGPDPRPDPVTYNNRTLQVPWSHNSTFFSPYIIRLHKSRLKLDGRQDQPDLFLSALPISLNMKSQSTNLWLKSILTEIEYESLQKDERRRLLLANDLASYFSLYHSMLVEDESGHGISVSRFQGSIEASEDFSALDSAMSTRYSPPIEASMIVKPRAKAYRLLSEIINRIQFGKTKMPNISKINNYVKRENVSSLYAFGGGSNIPNTLGESIQNHILQTYPGYRTSAQIESAVTDFFNQAPAQVKALVSYAANSQTVSQEMNQVLSTDNLDMSFDYVSSFQYKTQVINQLEVLDGYWLNSQGGTMLKNPKWEPYKDAAVTSGRSYLCRIMPYVNEKYLVDRNKNYDLPTYDEYFIMVT
jgi:hypothetical protein